MTRFLLHPGFHLNPHVPTIVLLAALGFACLAAATMGVYLLVQRLQRRRANGKRLRQLCRDLDQLPGGLSPFAYDLLLSQGDIRAESELAKRLDLGGRGTPGLLSTRAMLDRKWALYREALKDLPVRPKP